MNKDWESEFHKKFAPVGGDEFDWDKHYKTIHFISSQIKQAEERERWITIDRIKAMIESYRKSQEVFDEMPIINEVLDDLLSTLNQSKQ
jgi:hypothetical protein